MKVEFLRDFYILVFICFYLGRSLIFIHILCLFQHLVVINLNNEVIGMITRKEIAALEPELTPFPRSKITLYKKTSVINHRRTIENKRNGVRRRKVTLTTNSDSYRRFS